MTRALFLIIAYIQICSNFLFFYIRVRKLIFFINLLLLYLFENKLNKYKEEELITIKKFLFNFIFK